MKFQSIALQQLQLYGDDWSALRGDAVGYVTNRSLSEGDAWRGDVYDISIILE